MFLCGLDCCVDVCGDVYGEVEAWDQVGIDGVGWSGQWRFVDRI